MQKEQLVSVLNGRTGAPRPELSAKTVSELERLLDESFLQQVRAEAASSPAAQEAQRKIDEVNQDRLRQAQQHHLAQLFRIPIDGRVLAPCIANERMLMGWLDETRGETLSPAWFVNLFKENPSLAQSLSWVSADSIDPKKIKQAEAALAQADRRVFEKVAK